MNAQIKREITYFIAALSIVLPILGYANNFLESSETIVIQAKDVVDVTITPTPTLEPIVQPQEMSFANDIEEYIYKVFGDDYDKAMLLLHGVAGVCGGENRGLRSDAVYENKREDGTVWSRDRGIFQINSVYHPLTDEEAFDYTINVSYAKKMFDKDGYTFSKRWAAGKCLKNNGYDI